MTKPKRRQPKGPLVSTAFSNLTDSHLNGLIQWLTDYVSTNGIKPRMAPDRTSAQMWELMVTEFRCFALQVLMGDIRNDEKMVKLVGIVSTCNDPRALVTEYEHQIGRVMRETGGEYSPEPSTTLIKREFARSRKRKL